MAGQNKAGTQKARASEPNTLDRVTFGKRLRAARKHYGLTLAEVAQQSGISITTISRAERGLLALSYEKFSALGQVLRMDMAAMFSGAGTKAVRLLPGHRVFLRVSGHPGGWQTNEPDSGHRARTHRSGARGLRPP